MATEADETDEGIRRALDAADAANTAAQEIAELSAAHRAFAEAVMKGQKRNTLMASGAAVGAVVALMLGGLVYLRSVADLREAGEVQVEAAKLLVEELNTFDSIGDTITAQQDLVLKDIAEMLEEVRSEIAVSMQSDESPMDAQMATAIRDGVKQDLQLFRDELFQALAEMDLKLSEGGAVAGGPEMEALLEHMATLTAKVGALEAAPAEPPAPAQPAAASSNRPTKPKPKPAAEPNPFTYP